MEGILIAIEGIDGAGKTTQAGLIARALMGAGETVVSSKEPTDGPWGQKIRESAKNGRMAVDDELQAFVEDRKEHVRDKIMPALRRGEIVILDRYFYSTVAYQGVRGADPGTLLADMVSKFPVPDLVLFVDVEPAVAMHRIASVRGDSPNTFERLDALQKSREIFLDLARADPRTIRTIDGHSDQSRVYSDAAHILLDTALKAKRCAKKYDCDIFYCSYREAGECQWASMYGTVSGGSSPATRR